MSEKHVSDIKFLDYTTIKDRLDKIYNPKYHTIRFVWSNTTLYIQKYDDLEVSCHHGFYYPLFACGFEKIVTIYHDGIEREESKSILPIIDKDLIHKGE